MKQSLKDFNGASYIFDKNAKTISIVNFPVSLIASNILAIINATKGITIQNISSSIINVDSVIDNVITLKYDTSSMENTDDMMILFDLPQTIASPATEASVALLKRLLKSTETLMTQDSLQRQRVVVESLPSLGTVSTVNQIAGIDARRQFVDQARNAYANGVRSNLSFH